MMIGFHLGGTIRYFVHIVQIFKLAIYKQNVVNYKILDVAVIDKHNITECLSYAPELVSYIAIEITLIG